MATQRYHYTECGLDNIYLVNGFESMDTPYGKAVRVEDREGLHRAIGLMLVEEKPELNGKEFRFLRHEMNLTQKDLAAVLDVNVQSVARWEKGHSRIDGPAKNILRLLYQEFIGGNNKIIEPLKKLAELDEAINGDQDELTFEDTDAGWEQTLAA